MKYVLTPQVVPLPRDITVADVLEAYQEAAPPRASGSAEADIFDEVISGIKLYFDRALGNILLYRFERQQYLNIKKKYPDFPMSQIYGSEHLLRLFGKYSNPRELRIKSLSSIATLTRS